MSDSEFTSQFEHCDHAGIGAAVDLIQQASMQSVKSADRVAIIPVPNDPNASFYLVSGENDEPELITPEPAIVSGFLGSVDQVAACAAFYNAALILISADGVLVKFDQHDNRPQYECSLELSRQMQLLQRLESGEGFQQRQFLDLLRVKLSGALDATGERLIDFVRKFTVRAGDVTDAELKRDRESLGRSVHSEVQSESGEMPEQITVSVRVFTDRALLRRVPIRCLVDFSTQTHEFRLIPDPEALTDAIDATLVQIGDLINGDIDKVYADKEKPQVLFGSF